MIRVGVIGVGSMGSNHVRVYKNMRNVELVGITDKDSEVATQVAEKHETTVLSRAELFDEADAVSIAVPTKYHYETARNALEAGVDVLIEKPFVNEIEKGRELIELAEQENCIIQIGHIERFNPAVMALNDILDGQDVRAFEVRRLGPDPGRNIDNTVVADLMIHDLDIIRKLVGEAPNKIQAIGNQDGSYATATCEFDDDVIATVTASWITQKKVRKLTVTTDDTYITVDYLDRDLRIYRGSMKQVVDRGGESRYRHESVIELPFVENSEPLKSELTAFITAVEERTPPVVTAEDGLEAIHLAKAVENSAF